MITTKKILDMLALSVIQVSFTNLMTLRDSNWYNLGDLGDGLTFNLHVRKGSNHFSVTWELLNTEGSLPEFFLTYDLTTLIAQAHLVLFELAGGAHPNTITKNRLYTTEGNRILKSEFNF